MAYNNGFPIGYPQMVMPQYQQPMPAQQPQGNGVVWVQGEAAAKSYLLAPNTTLALWDSERQTIYLKSADAAGMPTMKTLDYTIRQATATLPAEGSWATKEDIDGLTQQINALKARLDGEEAGKHE